jgi:hypothetical protein
MPAKTLLPVLPSVFPSKSVGAIKQPRISSLTSQFLVKKIKNSADAKSKELGGWDNTEILVSQKKKSETTSEEWAGAFFCRRYQDPLS